MQRLFIKMPIYILSLCFISLIFAHVFVASIVIITVPEFNTSCYCTPVNVTILGIKELTQEFTIYLIAVTKKSQEIMTQVTDTDGLGYEIGTVREMFVNGQFNRHNTHVSPKIDYGYTPIISMVALSSAIIMIITMTVSLCLIKDHFSGSNNVEL